MLQKEKAPTLGAYHILSEIKKDAYGILYHAVHEKKKTDILLRVIAPEITNNENFIVRFELLKPLIPMIEHQNLIQVLELDEVNNIFFIAYKSPTRDPNNARTLEHFDPKETADKQHTIYTLFEGIASGLNALEKVKDNYHKNGIVHGNLSSDLIYLDLEKSLLGKGHKLVPKIGGYFESFLFYGDDPSSPVMHRFSEILFDRERTDETEKPTTPKLYAREHFFSPDERRGVEVNHLQHQFSLGTMIYETLTRRHPKGIFPSLGECDTTIDPKWDEICNKCLSALSGNGYENMAEVISAIHSINQQQNSITPFIRTLEEKKIPEGMSLVVFHDKVILGASDGAEVEQPHFKAKLKPFFMDCHPVTCEQFSEFMSDYQPSSYSKDHQNPAVLVSWFMAKAYCKWRSEKEGLPPDTYRLPTEYEWEAAVRGTSGDQYPWGEVIEKNRLWCNQDLNTGTSFVKKFPPGRFGLYDMLGNVWEWTESTFKPHPFARGSTKNYSNKLRVVKGGCWFTPFDECRASARAAFQPNEKRGNIGFRCVRPV